MGVFSLSSHYAHIGDSFLHKIIWYSVSVLGVLNGQVLGTLPTTRYTTNLTTNLSTFRPIHQGNVQEYK